MTVIVILAMMFALLALRLYSVLGKRTGHEQQHMPAPVDDGAVLVPAQLRPAMDARPDPVRVGDSLVALQAQSGVRSIIGADRNFDVTRFLSGARSAYDMVLDAFWKGDKDRLAQLCDAQVLGDFSAAIDERAAAGHVLENRLVGIDTARIVDATLAGDVAQISVAFEADIAAVTRDADGNVIAGSMEDAVAANEVWTFARSVRAGTPDWTLVGTDDA